jgi:cysteine-rich repeat protein
MRLALASLLRLAAVCALFVSPRHAAAQLLEAEPVVAFDRGPEVKFSSYAVAAGADSSILAFARTWTRDINKSDAVVRLFSPAGEAVGGLVRVDEEGDDTFAQSIFSDTRGGFFALWRVGGISGLPLALRPLGPTGAPTGPSVVVSQGQVFAGAAAPLPSGVVALWNSGLAIYGVVLDQAMHAVAPIFTVTTFPYFSVVDMNVAARADGGFVVAWNEGGRIRGRVFDAAGTASDDVLDLAEEFEIGDVKGGPLGGFVVVGRRRFDGHRFASGVWARRFDDAGAPRGPSFLVHRLDPSSLVWPTVAFDPAGRFYVAWGLAAVSGARGRLYDADGRSIQASFRLGEDAIPFLILEPRPDGRFVEGWTSIGGDLLLQVRTPCVPPFHTACGDGVLQAPCERCDAGAANDDATPDACRTTCMPASCGDGVVDGGEDCDDGNAIGCDGCDQECRLESGWICGDGIVSGECGEECDDGTGNDDALPNACRTDCRAAHCSDGVVDDGEACDDGNPASCDGCSDHCVAEPGLACGDGIPEVLCGEQCDDANDVVGDGCSGPCRLERVRGGGSPTTDCETEWVVDNPTNLPLLGKKGGYNGTQVCRDGDPRCDFGAVAGSCTFHVRVCGNNTDVEECDPEPRLRSWELRAPSANKAASRPELAAVRAAFTAVPGAIIGPTQRDVCSNTLDVVVPLKANGRGSRPGSVVLKSYATLYSGGKDVDKLKLVCQP